MIEAALAARDPVDDFMRCYKWLEDALAYDATGMTMGDVAKGVQDGSMHFWPGKRSAAITEVAQFPRARFLNITLAGGELDELLDMIPSFKSWAAHLGCSQLTVAGRPGWERVLGRLGWKRRLVVLSIPVEGTVTNGQPI